LDDEQKKINEFGGRQYHYQREQNAAQRMNKSRRLMRSFAEIRVAFCVSRNFAPLITFGQICEN
jgi:hypothetical protein